MINYMTKVDNVHILSVNEKNVSVDILPRTNTKLRSFKYEGVTVDSNFKIDSYGRPFTTILVAVELARECMKQEAINESNN